jgi:hypothetical protein
MTKNNLPIIGTIAAVILLVFLVPKFAGEKQGVWSFDSTLSECNADRADEIATYDPDCVTSCFQITSSMESCVAGKGYAGWDDNINDWVYMYDSDETCRAYIDRQYNEDDTKMTAVVDCRIQPIYGYWSGSYDPTPACADTDTTSFPSVNINVKGTVTAGGTTRTDYCIDTTHVNEYSCSSSTSSSVLGQGYECNCVDGACTTATTCNTNADLAPCDGKVSLTELSAYTTKWKQGQVSLTLLSQATSAWKRG